MYFEPFLCNFLSISDPVSSHKLNESEMHRIQIDFLKYATGLILGTTCMIDIQDQVELTLKWSQQLGTLSVLMILKSDCKIHFHTRNASRQLSM